MKTRDLPAVGTLKTCGPPMSVSGIVCQPLAGAARQRIQTETEL